MLDLQTILNETDEQMLADLIFLTKQGHESQ